MAGGDFYESVWESVPEGLAPAHAKLRERFLADAVAELAREAAGRRIRALDVGCGEGHFAALLAACGAEVVAVDVAHEPLRRARAAHPDIDFRYVEPVAPVPHEDASFDLVWAGEVIEHVADTAAWLSEVRRVLRSGGRLLLSTPDHGRLALLAMALRPRRFDACFDPRSDHLRFYTRRTLRSLLEDFGFHTVEIGAHGGLPGARQVLLASARRRRF